MAIEKLTDTRIRKLKPKSKEYAINDGNGLYLRIKPNNTKLWFIRYTDPATNKKRKGGLGNYPNVSLAQARNKAKEYHSLISQGIDPIEHKKELKHQVKEDIRGLYVNVVDEWLSKAKANITNKTRKNARSMLINDITQYLTHDNIKDIKHKEIVKALEAKNATAPVMADKLFRYCNELWKWACTQGLCDYNITLNIDKKSIIPPRPTMHHKTITDLKELTRLVKALYGLGSDHSKANALKLLLHVPLRASNLTALRWDYVNFKDKTITIPRQEMKVKDPNLADFILPMSDEVLEILTNQREATLSKIYVFRSDTHLSNHIHDTTLNNALKKLGFDIRLHGFRSMYRSLANTHAKEHNTSTQAREAVLDHNSETSTERAYTHKSDYLEELKILLDWWSGFIIKLRDRED